MTSTDRFERELGAALADLAAARTPDYLPDILGLTARQRQRPAWTSLERWLPMDAVSQLASTPSFPWRRLLVVGLIALLLAAAVAVFVGAPLQRPAPLFGPAANGVIAYEVDGDIHVGDPAAGAGRAIVAGPDRDLKPRFSRDGTRLAFVREGEGRAGRVIVAAATGQGQTVVTPDPLPGIGELTFSPDGSQVLIAAKPDGEDRLGLAESDGSGFRWLDTQGAAYAPTFRPGDPSTILFVGVPVEPTGGESLRTLDLDTGVVTTLIEATPGRVYNGAPRYTDDGQRIAFSHWVPDLVTSAVFTMPADGSAEPVAVPSPPTICCEGFPVWSHDGTKLALIRWYDPVGEVFAVVDPAVGGTGLEFDVGTMGVGTHAFSPDDRYILAVPFLRGSETGTERMPQVLLDVSSGQVVPPGWTATSDPAWQRLAP
jgi:WD40-like Beta Propeller Repeat